jgi:hypothetical protein
MISRALDEICANVVGRTMFKVLMAKMEIKKMEIQIYTHNNPSFGSIYKKTLFTSIQITTSQTGSAKTDAITFMLTKKKG